MSDAAKPPSGPPLWSGLSLDDVRELIRDDVAELKRLYALKAADDELPPEQRRIQIRAEISAIETAHDQHFAWMKEIAARESRAAGSEAL